jgi:hypothetical protein
MTDEQLVLGALLLMLVAAALGQWLHNNPTKKDGDNVPGS